MHTLRNSYGKLSRILCFLFAVHFLNFSIDPKDIQPDFMAEDLTINDIESITEFIAEVVLGFEDMFVEHDEADGNGGSLDYAKVFFVSQGLMIPISNTQIALQPNYFISNADKFSHLAREISSPPPEA